MKIGLLITARLKSSRLPLKSLLDLNGRNVIERVIDRAKSVQGVDSIVLCTSPNPQDLELIKLAVNNGVFYFTGDEQDVLQRLLSAAKLFNLDFIISITGENPLFSVEYANRVVDEVKVTQADFTYFDGLPIGCAVYGIKTKALEVVVKVKKEVDTEIWGPLINRPEVFSINTKIVDDYFRRPSIRITNDYLEDYQFLRAIFDKFPRGCVPSLYDVMRLLDAEPSLLEINASKKQAMLEPEVLRRIENYFKENLAIIKETKNKIYSGYDF